MSTTKSIMRARIDVACTSSHATVVVAAIRARAVALRDAERIELRRAADLVGTAMGQAVTFGADALGRAAQVLESEADLLEHEREMHRKALRQR